MPLLASLISGLFASLATFFAQWVTKKTALGAAAVATFAALTLALMAVIATSINAVLAWGSLPHWFVVGFNVFMPSNFVPCVSAVISAHTAVAVYKWNVENLRILSYVT